MIYKTDEQDDIGTEYTYPVVVADYGRPGTRAHVYVLSLLQSKQVEYRCDVLRDRSHGRVQPVLP
jgi:hypothetical protein